MTVKIETKTLNETIENVFSIKDSSIDEIEGIMIYLNNSETRGRWFCKTEILNMTIGPYD